MAQTSSINAGNNLNQVYALLNDSDVVFWDFDGVIKESISVKSQGFQDLFLPYGREISERVRQHHEEHGGISRYEKIPLYLSWAGEAATPETIQKFCDRFSTIVEQAVIDAPWVPGVREYIQRHHNEQYYTLVTATPQTEIEQILTALGISKYFKEIHGAPKSKATIIQNVLQRLQCLPERCLLVGDTESDLNAAKVNNIKFLLRRTKYNQRLQQQYSGPMFDELNYE